MGKLGGIWAVFVAVAVLSGPARGMVVKDHVSDPNLWMDVGVLDHFIDPDPYWSSMAGTVVAGNDQQLDKVGIVWCKSSVDGEWNGGDFEELQWRFRFFPDTSSFGLAAMYDPPLQPNWETVFAAPINADWQTPIGYFLDFTLYYTEVDVTSLGITIAPGQTPVIVLVPESKLEFPQTITMIAASTGGPTAIGNLFDWYECGAYNLMPAGPIPFNWNYWATKVTTVIPGDANRDGAVNFSDYLFLSQNFGGTGKTWGEADFNGDGTVNFSDYLILSSNFGRGGVSEAETARFKAASSSLAAEAPTGSTPDSDAMTALPWAQTCTPLAVMVMGMFALGLAWIGPARRD